jgi:hypothetical protein
VPQPSWVDSEASRRDYLGGVAASGRSAAFGLGRTPNGKPRFPLFCIEPAKFDCSER